MPRTKCIRNPMNLKTCRKCKNLEESTKKTTSTATTPTHWRKFKEHGLESLERLLHIAYHIALRACPYNDFAHELEVQKLHKVKSFNSGSYENQSVCSKFINFHSKSLLNQKILHKFHSYFIRWFHRLCCGQEEKHLCFIY